MRSTAEPDVDAAGRLHPPQRGRAGGAVVVDNARKIAGEYDIAIATTLERLAPERGAVAQIWWPSGIGFSIEIVDPDEAGVYIRANAVAGNKERAVYEGPISLTGRWPSPPWRACRQRHAIAACQPLS